jgi:hypothetical protein
LSFPQYAGGTGGGNSSPGSSSANSRSTSQSFSNSQGRKSTNAINLAAKKRSAPAPPPGSTQVIYGTLPHALRYQGGYDPSDLYNSSQNNSDTYSTLPHLRNNSSDRNSLTNSNQSLSKQQHFDNKVYERFEPLMMQQANPYQTPNKNKFDNELQSSTKASHKRSPSSDSIGSRSINLGEFFFNASKFKPGLLICEYEKKIRLKKKDKLTNFLGFEPIPKGFNDRLIECLIICSI